MLTSDDKVGGGITVDSILSLGLSLRLSWAKKAELTMGGSIGDGGGFSVLMTLDFSCSLVSVSAMISMFVTTF